MSRLNTQVDVRETEPEIAFAAYWAGRPGDSPEERELQVRSSERRVNRLSEESDDGGEPADDSKDTCGDDDVE